MVTELPGAFVHMPLITPHQQQMLIIPVRTGHGAVPRSQNGGELLPGRLTGKRKLNRKIFAHRDEKARIRNFCLMHASF